jgi:hypothetical protein
MECPALRRTRGFDVSGRLRALFTLDVSLTSSLMFLTSEALFLDPFEDHEVSVVGKSSL